MRKGISILYPAFFYASALVAVLFLLIFQRDAGDKAIILLSGTAIILVVIALAHFIIGIHMPVKRLGSQANSLSSAEPLQEKDGRYAYELRNIDKDLRNHAVRLAEMNDYLEKLSGGNTDASFFARGEHDELGRSLVKLKESIRRWNVESQKRRKLEEHQNWASRGIAQFGQLIRDFEGGLQELSKIFISELARYVDMEVGAIFLLHYTRENEPRYELTGTYALNREKHDAETFMPGEGLVGRCAEQKESLVINDVPADYIRIRSGLGEEDPATIVLVPVMFEESVLGVIELATFSIVKQYKIQFLEQLGKSLGSSLSRMIQLR